jgi:deazaflavin-dependent oxidoreductase (nitroreductase family)
MVAVALGLAMVAAPSGAVSADDLRAVENASTVALTTLGRKSGQPRTVTIWFVHDAGRIYVQSGQDGATDWYRNLIANPAVAVEIGALKMRGRARPIDDPAETARVHALFERKYLRARVLGWLGGDTGHGKVVLLEQLEANDPITKSTNQ